VEFRHIDFDHPTPEVADAFRRRGVRGTHENRTGQAQDVRRERLGAGDVHQSEPRERADRNPADSRFARTKLARKTSISHALRLVLSPSARPPRLSRSERLVVEQASADLDDDHDCSDFSLLYKSTIMNDRCVSEMVKMVNAGWCVGM
jgi:hypothetical protein